MKSPMLFFLLFCGHFYIIAPGHAQSVQLDSTILAMMAENKVPCVGLAVIRNGQLHSVKVYGELAKGIKAPKNAVFNVASMTKPVVAMLVLRLANTNKWNLDEPLSNYFTDPDVRDDPRSKNLTTRHVLTHQSGFVNWRWLHPSKKLTFDADPGTRFGYSGEGFEYLRKALEKKFNKPLTRLVQEEIFGPLHMTDSRLTWDASLESRYAQNHDGDGKASYETVKATTANAADDLLTTAKDYALFCIAVVKGFGLKKEIYADMVNPQVLMRKNMFMGLGWQVIPGLPGGGYVLGHDGGDEGVNTIALFNPSAKDGIVILTNSDNGFAIAPAIVSQSMLNGKQIVEKIMGQ
ncbi:class A beta-lactamase-related serine hydrolase [Pedobacter chinensis]|uniref:Class A beta-lactamase-related serine hydrolase n=1 Tax=Pedobacter chinensis TaxID=2282421 RepID=A0A369Q2F8_9SPHI|nr:serine hydrolase domain-containing protein [Pedobacter chinensis]RDC57216.1 class A beta-lactamase-related serine hydrolase [Pedobacter chinensis]